jgi:hypothetical protein
MPPENRPSQERINKKGESDLLILPIGHRDNRCGFGGTS